MDRGKPVRPVLPAVPLLLLLVATSRCFSTAVANEDGQDSEGWYFWNTVTGEVQLDDPGGEASCSVPSSHPPEPLRRAVSR